MANGRRKENLLSSANAQEYNIMSDRIRPSDLPYAGSRPSGVGFCKDNSGNLMWDGGDAISVLGGGSSAMSISVASAIELPRADNFKGYIAYVGNGEGTFKSNGKLWTNVPFTSAADLAKLSATPYVILNPSGLGDEVAINAALAACSAAGGGVVKLNPGIFVVNNPVLSRYNNVYLVGSGIDVTTIRTSASYVSSTATSVVAFIPNTTHINNFGATNLTIDKKTNAFQGNGIAAYKNSPTDTLELFNGVFDSIKVVSNGSYANGPYEIWGQGTNQLSIRNCIVVGNNSTLLASATTSDNQGIELFGARDCFIYDNIISNIGNIALLVQTIASTVKKSEENIHVWNNSINTARYGISWNTSYDATNGPAHNIDIFIHNNTFSNISNFGLWGQHNTGSLTLPPQISNVNIYCNSGSMSSVLAYSTQCAIIIENQTAVPHNNLVKDYYVINNSVTDCAPLGSQGVMRVTYMDNLQFIANSQVTPVGSFGAFNVQGLLSIGNVNCNFEQNIIDGSRLYGIQAQGNYQCKFVNNDVYNYNSSGVGTAGIFIDNSSGNVQCSIIDNKLKTSNVSGGPPSINMSGANNIQNNHADNLYIGNNATFSINTASSVGTINSRKSVRKTFTVTAAATYTLTHKDVRADSIISLMQTTGAAAISIISIVCSDGSAVITFGSANSETFAYVINNLILN